LIAVLLAVGPVQGKKRTKGRSGKEKETLFDGWATQKKEGWRTREKKKKKRWFPEGEANDRTTPGKAQGPLST